MRYKTVEIHPNSEGFWDCYIREDSQDRVRKKTQPHNWGFFHFPASMSDQKAFNMLKASMLKAHRVDIARLTKSMKKLEALQLKKAK